MIVTCAEGVEGEGDAGTVTLQVFWAGQLVGATWPLNVATIWPLELKKLDPATTMACPAAPLAGESEEMTGGPPAAGAAVVDVVELGGDGTVLVPAAAREGGDGPVLTDTTSAMAAATTRTATTATDRISQRSERPFPDGGAATASRSYGAGCDAGGVGVVAPAVSLARRTALSIAPRAR